MDEVLTIRKKSGIKEGMGSGTYRKGGADYAKMYYKATGHSLLNLIEGGMSNEDIRLQFRKNYLRPPSHSYLNWYRGLFKNPVKMINAINTEFADFLTSKLGIGQVSADRILDTIMIIGLSKLREKEEVSVSELIKAIQIRKQFGSLTPPGDLQKQIDDLLEGKFDIKEECDGARQSAGEAVITDTAKEADVVSEDKIQSDSESSIDTLK